MQINTIICWCTTIYSNNLCILTKLCCFQLTNSTNVMLKHKFTNMPSINSQMYELDSLDYQIFWQSALAGKIFVKTVFCN